MLERGYATPSEQACNPLDVFSIYPRTERAKRKIQYSITANIFRVCSSGGAKRTDSCLELVFLLCIL